MPKTKFYAYNPETGRDKRIKRKKTAPIGVSDNPSQYQFSAYNPSTGRSKKIRESGVTKTRTPRARKYEGPPTEKGVYPKTIKQRAPRARKYAGPATEAGVYPKIIKQTAPKDPNAPKKSRGPRKYGPNNRPAQSPTGRVLYSYDAEGHRTSTKNPKFLTPKQTKRAERAYNLKRKREARTQSFLGQPAQKITRRQEAPF